MASQGYPYCHANFAGDRRHCNPMIEAFLHVPPPAENIYTPPLRNKQDHHQRRLFRKAVEKDTKNADTDSLASQASFASTVSLIKRKFHRRAKH